MLLLKMIICWWRPPRSRPWGSCDFPPSTLQTSCNRPEDGSYLSYMWVSRKFEMIRNIYIIMNSTCFKNDSFGVVFLTFSRAAAASSVLGISVTTCLTKFLIWISTRFELPRIPNTLLTDYSLLDSDNWPDPSFHFFRQIATLLFQQRSTHLPWSMIFIIFDYLYYLLSMLQPETFDPKKFCRIETGSSARWILAWF